MGSKPGGGEAQASPPSSSKRRRSKRIDPADLSAPERRKAAFDAAMRLLVVRERSEAEIRQALRRRGFDADTAAATTLELTESGALSDERYAAAYAGQAADRAGYAAASIRMRLREKGVSAETATAAAAVDPAAEEERARAVAGRRARALGSLPPEVRLRRLEGFLARRGYPVEVCRRVASEVTGAVASEVTGAEEPPDE